MALAPQLVLFAAAAALLSSLLLAATAAGQKAGLPGCPTSCGGVSVPFPFGISPGCYLPGFNLTCDPSSAPSRLVLGNGTLQVSDISLHNSTVRVLAPDIHMDLPKLPLSNGGVASGTWGGQGWGLGDGGPYLLSSAHNEFIVTGCHFVAELTAGGGYIINGCSSTCTREAESDPRQRDQFRPQGDGGRRRCKTCTGIGCCQAPIPYGHTSYDVTLRLLNDDRLATIVNQNNFSVHIAEEGWFDGNTTTSGNLLPAVPAVLAWVIRSSVLQGTNETRDGDQTCPTDLGTGTCHSGNSSCTTVREEYTTRARGYTCKCWDGYEGNPYLPDGCQESNGLHHILDPQLLTEGGGEVVDVALLAAICVKFIGEERPTMRQVEMALEGIHAAKEYVSSNTDDESE
nr:unnamed protein product [Digitaria exilis]